MSIDFRMRLPELRAELAKMPESYAELDAKYINLTYELSEYERAYLEYIQSLSNDEKCAERKMCVDESIAIFLDMDVYVSSKAFQKYFEMPFEEFEADPEVISTRNMYKDMIVASDIIVSKCIIICKEVPDDMYHEWEARQNNGEN